MAKLKYVTLNLAIKIVDDKLSRWRKLGFCQAWIQGREGCRRLFLRLSPPRRPTSSHSTSSSSTSQTLNNSHPDLPFSQARIGRSSSPMSFRWCKNRECSLLFLQIVCKWNTSDEITERWKLGSCLEFLSNGPDHYFPPTPEPPLLTRLAGQSVRWLQDFGRTPFFCHFHTNTHTFDCMLLDTDNGSCPQSKQDVRWLNYFIQCQWLCF